MKRLLTEAEAWRETARRIEERGYTQGLCVDLLYSATSSPVWRAMVERLNDTFRPDAEGGTYFWARNPDWSQQTGPRIIAALLLAELAEEDAR